MNSDCSRIQDAMSAYFDGELSPSEQVAVKVHIESCGLCAEVLSDFRRLSLLTQDLRESVAPSSARSFDVLAIKLSNSTFVLRRRKAIVAMACAATLLVAIVAAWQFGLLSTHDSHARETAAVREYLREFVIDPNRAQQLLMAAYSGKQVTREEAARQFKHSLVASTAPTGYRIESTNVFDFPCCRCIQTVFTAEHSGPVVVLEHLTEQSEWFAERPRIEAVCYGVRCRVVELDGMLAITWKVSSHQVTLIGLKDLSQLSIWTIFLNDQQAVSRPPGFFGGVSALSPGDLPHFPDQGYESPTPRVEALDSHATWSRFWGAGQIGG